MTLKAISIMVLLIGATSARSCGQTAINPAPIVLPFEMTPAGYAVRIEVAGTERRMLLETGSPFSYVASPIDGPVEVRAGSLRLGRVRFAKPVADHAKGVDGVLGMDLLQGMAVGYDERRREFTLWPRDATPTRAEAEAWTTGLPSWGGPSKSRRASLGAFPSGAPYLELVAGGLRTKALLSFGTFNTDVAPTATLSSASLPDGLQLLARPSLGGVALPWMLCRRDDYGREIQAVIGVASLEVRRALVDLKAGTLYVEDLSEDARLSYFLSSLTRISLDLRGDGLVVQLPPGSNPAYETASSPLQGMPVVRLAGVPAKEWVDALRGKGEAKAEALAALLSKLLGVYEIEVQAPDGVRSYNVPIG